MRADVSTPHRVFVHVGAPKSGTTFLQKALWLNREPLLQAGFRCPGTTAREMFLAAIEVRETQQQWGFRPDDLLGTWRRLCQEARQYPGTSIMSHELLAAATVDQIARARAPLDGLEVHVVLTARDLARQVVSEWQERTKNGSTASFAAFQTSLMRRIRTDDLSSLFWRYQDVPEILSRWGLALPPEHVHVVTAPRSGSDPGELWRRFGDAVGLDVAGLEPTAPDRGANQSLGIVEIAILRRVNEALGGRIVQPAYARVVKRLFAQDLLARHTSPRPSCPSELGHSLRELSARWIEEIERRGYAVHGDLADLLPEEPADEVPFPDEVDAQEQADVSAAVIADLLVEVAALRGRVRRLSRSGDQHRSLRPATPFRRVGHRTWRRIRSLIGR